MADRWFYAHDDKKIGPFSGQQLRDLAASRQILPTDTVWKDGIDKGVFATKVRYLFASTPSETPSVGRPAVVPSAVSPLASETVAVLVESKAVEIPSDPSLEAFPDNIQLQPETDAPAPAKQPTLPPPSAPRKRRAIAVKGAIIVGQDGAKVRFRKKCTPCGYEESSWSVLPITNGTMRAIFFCPKCRMKGAVEIRGVPA